MSQQNRHITVKKVFRRLHDEECLSRLRLDESSGRLGGCHPNASLDMHSHIISLVFVLSVVFTGCGDLITTLSYNDDGAVIVLDEGETVDLELRANDVWESWVIVGLDESIVRSSVRTESSEDDDEVLDWPGLTIFSFTGMEGGSTRLQMVYRSDRGGSELDTFELLFLVI